MNELRKVLREFGPIGLITYVGGLVIISVLTREDDFQGQIFWGLLGFLLLVLSFVIAYYRIKIQRDREQALIEMNKQISNRLAEQLGKDLSNKQIVSITQTIWQNQKDSVSAILSGDTDIKKLVNK